MPDGLRLAAFAAYALTALLAWSAAGRAHGRERTAWLVAAVMLVFLGAAKLIQLESALTDVARGVVTTHGWYGDHRELQLVAALAILLCACVMTVLGAWWLRPAAPSIRLAAGAVGLLLVFGVIRAASIHAVDLWVTAPLFGLKRGWWIELAGLLAVASAALNHQARASAISKG